MQANIELALKTREVFKLFERKIDGDRLFIEAILHKFYIVMKRSKGKRPRFSATYNQIEQAVLTLTRQFMDEANRFEALLTNHKDFSGKKVNFIPQFHVTIIVNTPLSMRLLEFIEIYDKLIAILKLLYLAGFFTSDNDYYANIKRFQTVANHMLSNTMLVPILD